MVSYFKKYIGAFSSIVPFSVLKNRTGYPRILPFYHCVSDIKIDYISSYPVRTEAEFERELDFLLKQYKPVSLNEIINNPSASAFHLTFDDGLKECYSVIAPILKRKGIPATFFVNPGFVDNKAIFHRFKQAILVLNEVPISRRRHTIHDTSDLDRIAEQNTIDFNNYKPYMTLSQLQELRNDGFVIGAHSLDHPEMWLLNEDEQFAQIAESMKWVTDHFKPEIRAFSFPFTDDGIKYSLFEKLKNEQIVDVSFGTAGLKYDHIPNHYQRIPVEHPDNWTMKKVLHFEYFYFFVRSLFGKNYVKH